MKRFMMTTAIATVLSGAAFAQEATEEMNPVDEAVQETQELANDAEQTLEQAGEEVEQELTAETETETDVETDMAAETEVDGMGEMDAETDTEMATETEGLSTDLEGTATADADVMGDPTGEIAPELAALTVGEVIGMGVETMDGESIGEIDYVIDDGNALAGVIGIGGFLGLGEYTVAVALSEFQVIDEGSTLVLDHSEEELKALPEIDESELESLEDDIVVGDYSSTSGGIQTEMGTEAETDMNPDS